MSFSQNPKDSTDPQKSWQPGMTVPTSSTYVVPDTRLQRDPLYSSTPLAQVDPFYQDPYLTLPTPPKPTPPRYLPPPLLPIRAKPTYPAAVWDRTLSSSATSKGALPGGAMNGVYHGGPRPIQRVPPLASRPEPPRRKPKFGHRLQARARINSGRDTSSWNSILRPIMETRGVPYGPDREGDELAAMCDKALHITENHVSAVIEALENTRKVSLCFLVDATASMEPHIAGVRKYIRLIVDQLVKSRLEYMNGRAAGVASKAGDGLVDYLELAFVGYRDLGAEAVGLYEVFEFSTDVDAFCRFVSSVVTYTGIEGDFCEHALGGIEKALSLKWNANSGTKLVFHIADAPCHGRKFHDLDLAQCDHYPDGVPGEPGVDQLFDQFQSQNILYYFGEITPHTKKMVKVFSESYGDTIKTYDIRDPINILAAVVESVAMSVGINAAASKSGSVGALERTHAIVEAEPDWTGLPEYTVSAMVYELPAHGANFNNGMNKILEGCPLKSNSRRLTSVKIAPYPFDSGIERQAYYGYVRKTKVVFKESKAIGRGHDSAAGYQLANEMQTISSFLAIEFNRRLKDSRNSIAADLPTLKFLMVKTVSFPESNGRVRVLSQENFIQNASKFVRFTNNANYILPRQQAAEAGITYDFVELVMAFCHWTHAVSKGFLMVVDLEGCLTNGADPDTGKFEPGANPRLLLLTDPAIHSTDQLRYGPLNFGKRGFEMFFKDHKCNKFCRVLGIEKL